MGINPTPTNHRSFTFDGKSTREFGVYITGEGVFNAPERAVEMISIPGRDGEYALDQGHFNNIEVTYRAGIVADSTTDFAEAISNFRNWLASREGYCRLTDEYNTEEYRMAVFKNAIALEHEGLLTGEFDVTFDCKPQRYLAIGEELVEIGAWGNTETAEGEVVTIDASSDTAVKALTADIVPVQSGSGTPSPDNVRPISGHDEVGVSVVGKNLLDTKLYKGISYYPTVGSTPTIIENPTQLTDNGDGTFSITLTTSYQSIDFIVPIKKGVQYHWKTKIESNGTEHGVSYGYLDESHKILSRYNDTALSKQFDVTLSQDNYLTGDNGYFYVAISDRSSAGATITITQPQLELGTTATTYEPYNGTDYTTTLPSTTYGGTLDVVSGVLTVDKASTSGAITWQEGANKIFNAEIVGKKNVTVATDRLKGLICSAYPFSTNFSIDQNMDDHSMINAGTRIFIRDTSFANASAFSAFMADKQIVYELATPQTYQLTPQQVALLLGENNIFADSGNVKVEYGHNPTLLTNPTWFPSKPLLAVEGYGLLKLGKSEIDLDNVPVGDITLLEDNRFRLTQTAANTYSVTFTIDEGALNVGDDITASINALPFRFYIVGNGASISPSSYTVADTNSDFVSSLSLGYGGSDADFSGETVINVKFDSGTSSTITNTVSGNLVVKKTYPTPTSNITLTYSVTETVAYDASAHTITLTETATITYSSAYITSAQLRTTSLGASALITAYSTISIIQDEVFIDCDIGEAYTIKDGEPISLNQHIDLGSDLPTLPPGDTEVTYDNTITKVEVKPNWWKV